MLDLDLCLKLSSKMKRGEMFVSKLKMNSLSQLVLKEDQKITILTLFSDKTVHKSKSLKKQADLFKVQLMDIMSVSSLMARLDLEKRSLSREAQKCLDLHQELSLKCLTS